jgi:CheY-like chemotaxis protein
MSNDGKWQLDVLLVEDDSNDVELFTRAFIKSGRTRFFQVVRDGEEAIDYLRGQPPYEDRDAYPPPNVIITDLKMPRTDGFRLLQWLHDHPECAVIPTIVLSGSALEGDVRKAYSLGASAFMNKPAGFGKLVRMVEAIFAFWSLCERPEIPVAC